MDSTSPTHPPASQGNREFEQQLREMNEALLVSSVKHHELAEKAQKAEALVRETQLVLAKAIAYADDIIATLREPFLILDHNLRVKSANRSFYDLFLVSKEETENNYVYDLGDGQWDIPALRKMLDEVLSRRQSIHDYEVEHSFPSLGRKTMILNARPFPPDSQHPELILLAVEDVSAIRERADELADLDRRKNEFLAMLSHELRNPLTPILNSALLLRLHCDRNRLLGIESPVVHQAAIIIERQGAHMARIIDELLEVSRITTGQIQLHKEQLVVGIVVEHAVASVRSQFDEYKHELSVSLPEDAIWLHADPARLQQILVNLLTNAAKYTDPGGRIWLTVEQVRAEGQRSEECVIRVRDTGVGIDPETLPRIFDLFTQAERTLDRSQGGLGIGLALVQRLVELHRGTVTASSVVGQGSEFVVRLPAVSAPSPNASAPPAEKKRPVAPSLRVLVVDDNVDTVTTLALLVKESGHDVRTAFDGPSVLETALEYRPQLVLLDIGLPGLNGFEVAKRLRQQPTLQNVVLVAMTGYGQEGDRQRSQEAGFNHHLVKPGDFGKLLQILASIPVVP